MTTDTIWRVRTQPSGCEEWTSHTLAETGLRGYSYARYVCLCLEFNFKDGTPIKIEKSEDRGHTWEACSVPAF